MRALLLLLLAALGCATARPELMQSNEARRLLAKKPAAPAAEAGAEAAACCAELAAAGFSSNLPVVVVYTAEVPVGAVPKPQTSKIPVKYCTCNAKREDGTPSDTGGTASFSERGSHSEDFNQVRSYGIKLDAKAHFMGMPAATKWAIYGPQNDTMGFHNWFAQWLYRQTGNYAVHTQYCEMFLVPSQSRGLQYPGDYLGLHLVLETIERDKDRVDITKIDPSKDITGGYILDNEHGKSKGNLTQIQLAKSTLQYLIAEPPKPTTEEVQYITGYLNDFEGALLAPNFADPAAGYRHYVNISTMRDYFLFEELAKNYNDGYRGSQRLNKDAGGPLNFGPPWDFDEAFGTCCGWPIEGYQNGGQSNGSSGGSAISPEGWLFSICAEPERCKIDPLNGITVWYRRVWQDPYFRTAAAQRFQQLRGSVWTDAAIAAALRGQQATIHDAAMRTFARWPVDFVNPYAGPQPNAEAQLQATVDTLIAWVTKRLVWFEGQFGAVLAQAGGMPAASTAG